MNRKKIVKLLIILLIIIGIMSLIVFLYNRNHKTAVVERRVESYTEYGNSIIAIDDGYIIVGSNDHNLNKYEKASISLYDSNKNKILEKVYNKGYNSTYYDVISDGDNYVVVGSYEATKRELEDGLRTAFIVKYDKNFEIVFEDDFQVISNSHYNKIIKVEDGYIVCGDSINLSSELGNSGAILIKYDLTGKEIWRKYFGNTNASYKDLIYLNGYIYTCGVENNIGVISQYDLEGNLLNNIYYDEIDNDGFTSIISINNILFATGGKMLDNNSNGVIISYDIYLNKINEVTNSKYDEVKFNKLMVDQDDNLIVIGNMHYYHDDDFSSDGVIGKYTIDLKEKGLIKLNSNMGVIFNNLVLSNDKYVVLGNYEDSNNIIAKLFIFSSSLKSLGA